MHSNKLTSGLGAGESRARTGSPLAVALLSQKSRAGSQSSSESTLPSPRPTLTRIEHTTARSGTARDWPGTPGTPLFTGLLGTARDQPGTPGTPIFTCPGLAQDWPGTPGTPLFTGPGPLRTSPGLPSLQFLQVRDRSGPARDSRATSILTSPGLAQYPNFYRYGTARDWPGTPGTPIFTGPGPLGTSQGLPLPPSYKSGTRPIPQFLQLWDRSGLARDSSYPNLYRPGTARD